LERRGWLPPAPGGRVITMGNSLGASTVLQHAAHDKATRGERGRVAGVVALCPFANMKAAIDSYRKLYAPFVPRRWLLGGFTHAAAQAGFAVEEACALTAIGELDIPVLLVGGENDVNLSLQDHTRVLAAAKTRGPVKLIEVPKAHHFNLYRETWPGLDEAIVRFCGDLG